MTEQEHALFDLLVEVDRMLLCGSVSDDIKGQIEYAQRVAKRSLGLPETGFIVHERPNHDERN